jgi:3-deoxy-D-manno-octulosonic-acid transferase
MTVNLPFSGLGFAVGPMVRVPREATPAELEGYREAVQASLEQATALAFARAGADSARATPRSALASVAKPGLSLKAYRAATALARPATPLLLGLRERNGKEDHARRPERLGCANLARPPGRLAWFHAASVGETLAVLPLISALGAERPSLSFLLTTGTVTSAELARQRIGPRTIHQYAPLDVPRYVQGFLEHWKPDLAVFAESEIWPNLIMQSAERKIPLALINARMTKRSFRRWRRLPGLAQPLFGQFALVLAQNETLAHRFSALGAPVTMSVGNLKVDAPAPPVDSAALERLRPAFAGRPLLMAASTHDGEDQVVAEAHRALAQSLPDLCTIIAPRHPERGAAITEMLKEKGLHVTQRSLGVLPDRTSEAYVADTIGELGTLYKLAPVAFIGGSLVNRGGQNPIEAVRQGAVVLTGPHWHNFGDAYDVLIRDRGAIVVHSADELASAARQLITDQTELGSMRQRADAALAKISGALPRTITALLSYLPNEEGLVRAS